MLTFPEPPHVANERDTLLTILDQQRYLVLWKLKDLSAELRGKSTVDSGTSLLGTVKHLAWVERWWFSEFIGGVTIEYPWSEADPDADWHIDPDDSIEAVSNLYVTAVAESNRVIEAQNSLGVTGTHNNKDRSLRWVIVHMIDETARHLGQMDIIREQLDGQTGYLPER